MRRGAPLGELRTVFFSVLQWHSVAYNGGSVGCCTRFSARSQPASFFFFLLPSLALDASAEAMAMPCAVTTWKRYL